MTDDEKRRQKADLLLDFQEAEQELAHLEEHARRGADALRSVASWLGQLADRTSDFSLKQEKKPDFSSPIVTYAMDIKACEELEKNVTAGRSKLRDLKQRKDADEFWLYFDGCNNEGIIDIVSQIALTDSTIQEREKKVQEEHNQTFLY